MHPSGAFFVTMNQQMNDPRNLIDIYKGKAMDDIISSLDENGVGLEIAVENLERDFNMGTIVRSANAFGVRHVHVIGKRQWNKRGAMMTDKYLHVHYHASIDEFIAHTQDKAIVAIDNVEGSVPLHQVNFTHDTVLVFGSEGPGISQQLLNHCREVVAIEQFGSTRSINVGVAAGIAMYVWLQQNRLP